MPLTSLRARPMAIHRVFFSLIMPFHIRKELLMPYQQEKCLKVFLILIPLLWGWWFFMQHPRPTGHTLRMHQGCVRAQTLWLGTKSHFTFLMTTPPCQGGSKKWSRLSESVVFGQKLVCLLSAQGLNALQTGITAAAELPFLTNLILFLRSQNFRSLLRSVVTSVTFTPNTTVNWTSLNSTEVLPNFAFVQQEEQQPLMTWKRRYWFVWIIFPLNRFVGANRFFLFLSLHSYHVYRYANRSARFIHAYEEGLTGAQAVWANKRYHSHRTLLSDMIREVKISVFSWGNFYFTFSLSIFSFPWTL